MALVISKLAKGIHVPPNRISQILAGKRSITADTALRLGKWFGTGPHIWLNLQHSYGLETIQQDLNFSLDEIKTRVAA